MPSSEDVRVALVTESFLPHVNGVTNSVLRVLEHLESTGHEAVVVAPGSGGPSSYAGAPVVRVASIPAPGNSAVRIALAGTRTVERILTDFRPDVVHLASPFILGRSALRAAQRLDVPVVAVFQTDMAGFLGDYGWASAQGWAWRRLERIHGDADLTVVPSTATFTALAERGIPRLAMWRRGVDAERFHPDRRDDDVRRRLGSGRPVLVGYVGRLGAEKEVAALAALSDLPDVRVVVVGDGPARATLERQLPEATFLGFLDGIELATVVASLDVVVHPGRHETFCQSVQEALASGVPVVAAAAGGLLDLVDPSRTGWLYPPGDLTALRDRVRDLVGDEAKRQAMGRAARASVADRSWSSLGRVLVRHYEQTIRSRTRPMTARR